MNITLSVAYIYSSCFTFFMWAQGTCNLFVENIQSLIFHSSGVYPIHRITYSGSLLKLRKVTVKQQQMTSFRKHKCHPTRDHVHFLYNSYAQKIGSKEATKKGKIMTSEDINSQTCFASCFPLCIIHIFAANYWYIFRDRAEVSFHSFATHSVGRKNLKVKIIFQWDAQTTKPKETMSFFTAFKIHS